MKKFYILFTTIPVLLFTLAYFSPWWALVAIGVIMIFIIYRLYAARVHSLEWRSDVLSGELEELHARLEQSVTREQKALKEVELVKQSKQQLLSVISHEIRTPMNGVLGTTVLLADTELNNEQQECIDTIRNCGESLLTTINNILANDILDYSKLHHEGGQLEYKGFDLRNSIEEVLEMFSVKAGESGLDLIYCLDEDVPEQIIGDSKRLRQVLMNLVENAVTFTQKGEVFVAVHYAKQSATGSHPELTFEVHDTGIGISREQLKQLLKGIPAKEVQKISANGSAGLGLVVCRKLVELMGGTIQVKSQEGQGTVASFSIPITPMLKSIRNQAELDSIKNLEGKRVLITDRNTTTRTVLMKQLQLWKMRPTPASSGKEALELLARGSFDLVLTDINMSDEADGKGLANSIRSQFPGLPVIGMQASVHEKYKPEANLFSSVIFKPIRQYMLREHLTNALSKNGAGDHTKEVLSTNFAQQYPLRILVAEDNLVNQKIALKILAKLGYKAQIANNGKEAIETVSHEHFDVILMDVQMPEMDGLEATRMIRTCLEVQPVIIALTANVMQGDRDSCMQAGMDDYMSKPIEMKELLSQLEKWALVLKNKRHQP